MPFVQVIEGHKYILCPVIQDLLEGNFVLKGADVYSTTGNPLGFWPVENMMGAIADRLRRYCTFTRRVATQEIRKVKSAEELEARNYIMGYHR